MKPNKRDQYLSKEIEHRYERPFKEIIARFPSDLFLAQLVSVGSRHCTILLHVKILN